MRRRIRGSIRWGILLCVLAFATVTPHAQGQRNPKKLNTSWQVIEREQGITVSIKEQPGRALPIFKAVGIINAGMYEILAVLGDTTRHTEWLERCIKSKILENRSETEYILYNRTEAPWPVSDRDVVARSTIRIDRDKHEVWIRFRNTTHPMAPETDAVRIPRLRGFQHLQALDAKRTRLTYQVDADPGGFLPPFIVRFVQSSIPLNTLLRLRKQIKKTRGLYKKEIAEWTSKYGPFISPAPATAAASASKPQS